MGVAVPAGSVADTSNVPFTDGVSARKLSQSASRGRAKVAFRRYTYPVALLRDATDQVRGS